MGKYFFVLNVYGPYSYTVNHSNTLFKMELVYNGLVLVGGDLNFTLGS
jgi:hypothetical protein